MTEVIDLSKPKNTLKEFDAGALWEKQTFIDMAAGEIIMLIPVTVGRVWDTERQPRFFSSVTAARGGQPIQISFEIEGAVTLEDAIRMWMDVANAQAEEFHRKAEDALIRSRLTVPAGARMTKAN